MKTNYYTTALLFALTLTGCQSNDLETPQLSKADIIGESLKFLSAEDHLAQLTPAGTEKMRSWNPNTDKDHITIDKGDDTKNEPIKIFSTVIGRPKYGCHHGFGFCYTRIFGIRVGYPYNRKDHPEETNEKTQTSIIQKDFLGRYYTELQLSELPEKINLEDMPDLRVDEPLRARDTTGTTIRIFDIKEKSFRFDPSIGRLGGYRIYFEESKYNMNLDIIKPVILP